MNRKFTLIAILGVLAVGLVVPVYAKTSAWQKFYDSITGSSNAQKAWEDADYKNSWGSYNTTDNSGSNWGSAQYFKDTNGIVHLRGLIVHSDTGDAQKAAFTLPEGYRPTKHYMYGLFTTGDTVCRGDMRTNGDFIIYGGCIGKDWVSIAGLTFRAEQ